MLFRSGAGADLQDREEVREVVAEHVARDGYGVLPAHNALEGCMARIGGRVDAQFQAGRVVLLEVRLDLGDDLRVVGPGLVEPEHHRRVGEAGAVHGDEVVGFLDAWDGVMEQRLVRLDVAAVRGLLPRGGTVIGTRRGSPFDHRDGVEKVRRCVEEQRLDALVVIGGNGSLTVASLLFEQTGLPIIGVPKTIDNDIVGTDLSFGFHTAVQIATDAIEIGRAHV